MLPFFQVANQSKINLIPYRRAMASRLSTLVKSNLPSSGSICSQYTSVKSVLPWSTLTALKAGSDSLSLYALEEEDWPPTGKERLPIYLEYAPYFGHIILLFVLLYKFRILIEKFGWYGFDIVVMYLFSDTL